MDDRRAQLALVEPTSFEWIWSKTSFPLWLESEDGVFWISGKPASGKSTLMHHLAGSKDSSCQILRRLEQSGKKWLLAHFYFDFRAGSGIANNKLGLLRSLLSQLVKQSSKISDFMLTHCSHRWHGNWPDLEAELLDLACDAVKSTNVSICALIDGLDEYEGDLGELIVFLLQMQRRSGIKVCLASRPETELQRRLHNVPTFAMQTYNHNTIKSYVEVALAEIGHFVLVKRLRHVLNEEVVAHADGVILWAIFAVNEAIKAALHGHSLRQIRQRIGLFPQELNTMYTRIWDKLNTQERRFASIVLFVVQSWRKILGQRGFDIAPASFYLNPCCRMLLRQLDPDFEVDPEYNELHFRLRTHALLGGLVEFVGPSHEARLAHRSVESFLEQLPDYVDQVRCIHTIFEVNALGPMFFARAILEVSDALVPDTAFLDRFVHGLDGNRASVMERGSATRSLLHRHLQSLIKDKMLDCMQETISSAIDGAVRFAYFYILTEPPYTHLVASVAQTWLMRYFAGPLHMTLISRFGAHVCEVGRLRKMRFGFERIPQVASSDLSENRPEAVYLAVCGFDRAFRLLSPNGRDLSYVDSVSIFHHLRQPTYSYPSERSDLARRYFRAVSFLEKLPWQGYYLSLLELKRFGSGEENEAVASLMSRRAQDQDFYLRPSYWWDADNMHLLLYWVWSPLCWTEKPGSLDVLLKCGVTLDSQIYEGGTALHAFLDPDARYRIWRKHYNCGCGEKICACGTYFELFFSARKFDMLIERGADVRARGKYGTVQETAQRLMIYLQKYESSQHYFFSSDINVHDITFLKLILARIEILTEIKNDFSGYDEWAKVDIPLHC